MRLAVWILCWLLSACAAATHRAPTYSATAGGVAGLEALDTELSSIAWRLEGIETQLSAQPGHESLTDEAERDRLKAERDALRSRQSSLRILREGMRGRSTVPAR